MDNKERKDKVPKRRDSSSEQDWHSGDVSCFNMARWYCRKRRMSLEEAFKKIAEMTGEPYDEIRNRYSRGRKRLLAEKRELQE